MSLWSWWSSSDKKEDDGPEGDSSENAHESSHDVGDTLVRGIGGDTLLHLTHLRSYHMTRWSVQ